MKAEIKSSGALIAKNNDYGVVDLAGFIESLPKESDRILIDRRVAELDSSGVRVFRLYNHSPLHYHAQSDTYLYILSGRGRFQVADEQEPREAGAGSFLFWKKGVYHGYMEVLEHPLDVLAFDSPAGNPNDVVFADPRRIPDVFLR